MCKFEKHAVIKYLFLKGMFGKVIHDDMLATLGYNAAAYSVLKCWLAKFKRGRNSVEDEHRLRCPKDAASTENVHIVNDMLKEDRRLTIQHTAETTDIHDTAVYRIVSDDVGMKKVSACWVPRMLTDEQKQNRVNVRTDLFLSLASPATNFSRQDSNAVLMQDETWVHHFDLERKRQNMVWKHATSSTHKKFKVTPSAGKVLATVFETLISVKRFYSYRCILCR